MGGDFYIRTGLFGKIKNKSGKTINVDIFLKRHHGYYLHKDEDDEPELPEFNNKKLYDNGKWLITYLDRIEYYKNMIILEYGELGEIIELYKIEHYQPR